MLQVRSMSIRHLALLLVALTLSAATGVSTMIAAPPVRIAPHSPPDFGPQVTIFNPSMPISEIQATVDAIYAQQVDAEMSTNRYALLFKPGV